MLKYIARHSKLSHGSARRWWYSVQVWIHRRRLREKKDNAQRNFWIFFDSLTLTQSYSMEIEMAIKTRNSHIHMSSNVYSSSDDFFNNTEFNLLFNSLMSMRCGEIHSLNEIENTQKFHCKCVKFPVQWYFLWYFSSFLIGDNDIYEGTGWHKRGAHTYKYNSNSTGIAFVGSFNGN